MTEHKCFFNDGQCQYDEDEDKIYEYYHINNEGRKEYIFSCIMHKPMGWTRVREEQDG